MYVGCYFVTPFKFISGYEVQPKHKEGFLFSVGGHKAGLNRILYYQIHQDDLEELKISEIADFNVNYLPLFLRDCVKDRSFYDYTEELEKSRLKDVKHVVENKENDIIYRMNYAQGVLMDWENVVDSLILEDMKKIRYENNRFISNNG